LHERFNVSRHLAPLELQKGVFPLPNLSNVFFETLNSFVVFGEESRKVDPDDECPLTDGLVQEVVFSRSSAVRVTVLGRIPLPFGLEKAESFARWTFVFSALRRSTFLVCPSESEVFTPLFSRPFPVVIFVSTEEIFSTATRLLLSCAPSGPKKTGSRSQLGHPGA